MKCARSWKNTSATVRRYSNKSNRPGAARPGGRKPLRSNTGCVSAANDVVVDTNVVAYYLLGTEPFADEARAFWRGGGAMSAPAHWQAELANVIWMAVR